MSTKELSYEVIESIGVISEKNSYTKEVNVISWNGRPPVCDIRDFRVDKEGVKHPLKGISMARGRKSAYTR